MKTIELFAGAGGLGLGLEKCGFHPEQVVEWDRWCCDTLIENKDREVPYLKDWDIVCGDVRNIDFTNHEGVDLVSGGPPCQPFSLGGKHRAVSDNRDMFPEAVRAVRECKPKAFVFENVKGLTRKSFQSYFQYIQLQLEHPEVISKTDEEWVSHLERLENHHLSNRHDGLHYNIVCRVLNAADYGVPQARERVFIVGFRSDLDINWHFPRPTHSREALAWSQFVDGDYWDEHEVSKSKRFLDKRLISLASKLDEKPDELRWKTLRDAISDLPEPKRTPTTKWKDHKLQTGAKSYKGHTGSPIDLPSKTLKAGVHGVPGGENMLLRADGSVRYFTIRESARIQTFPDEYVFHGSWSETMRQLGNAVPVNLAQAVGQGIARELYFA